MSAAARSSIAADAIVIGAGIVGASCAYHLAERGLRVIVLEAMDSAALGSTARSNACVRAQWRDETNIALSWASIQWYRDAAEHIGHDSGYRPIGYLLLHAEETWDAQLAAVELQRAAGVPVDVLTPEEAQKRVPFEPDGIAGATFTPADGRIDPHVVTTGFLDAARQRGANIMVSAPVVSAHRDESGWQIAARPGGDGGSSGADAVSLTAPIVINAAGGWSGAVAALAGLEVPVTHSRRMLFATSAGQRTDLPMTIDTSTGFFIRSEGDRLLMGFGGEHEPERYETALDWAWLESVMEAGNERFPWILDLPMDQSGSWAGTYDMSPDHRPFLGRMPGAEGWINACGFSGHGVMQAPAVGRAIAEEAIDGRAHTVSIDALRIERLADGPSASRELVF